MVVALASAIGLGLGCGAEVPFSNEDSTQEQRIVSLSPSLTRLLVALGAGDELVAVDRFSRKLPDLEELPSLGGVFNTDLERTLELRPTLVLAVRSEQQAGFFDQLRSRGVRVEEVEVYTLEEVLDSFLRVGEYVDRRAKAEALVAQVGAELSEVRASVAGLSLRSVAVVIERDPLYVVGGGAFLDTLIAVAGGENVFADLHSPYPRVSLEALADRAPDLILDTFFDPARGRDVVADVQSYWRRFTWVRRAEPFPFAATHPAPNLSESARLLRARIHPPGEAP
jgi:iron complex transport system substrate-binding protein